MHITAGPKSYFISTEAMILDGSRELAWAEKHVIRNPSYAWLLAKYVEADNPNTNGQTFTLGDLQEKRDSVTYSPMNILHRPHQIVGAYVANELIYPTEGASTEDNKPYVEVLSVFWKDYFPEEYSWVERAYKDGMLSVSMECTPESLTCQECQGKYEYAGPQHSSYCKHMRDSPVAPRTLNNPHFQAGGLILPPSAPGWKNATVTDVSAQSIPQKELQLAKRLDSSSWEGLMQSLMAQAKSASEPHTFEPSSDPEQCEICSKKKKFHWKGQKSDVLYNRIIKNAKAGT